MFHNFRDWFNDYFNIVIEREAFYKTPGNIRNLCLLSIAKYIIAIMNNRFNFEMAGLEKAFHLKAISYSNSHPWYDSYSMQWQHNWKAITKENLGSPNTIFNYVICSSVLCTIHYSNLACQIIGSLVLFMFLCPTNTFHRHSVA